jgi:phosphoenolpyruvate---glycerone phosphotransferase subunit DhaK
MFDIQTGRALFSLLRERFTLERDLLNALDSAVGDGDHGHTILRGFKAAERASSANFADLGALFSAAAQAIAEQSGGAIGPLLGAFFVEGSSVLEGKRAASTADFARFFDQASQVVQTVGGAAPGQKTLLDALVPAASVLKEEKDRSLLEAFLMAAAAAHHGAQTTKEMVASHGRAHFLGERSRGYLDAGAVSMSIIVTGFADVIAGKKAAPQELETQIFQPPPGKLVNHPDQMVTEDNQGAALAYPNYLRYTPEGILVRTHPKKAGKVGIAIGHGGGHTPSMGGFVGQGLLDADAYGPIFTCASGIRIFHAIQAAERGGGVVLLISNHSGDLLNARLALRKAQQAGIQVIPTVLGDDIATAPRANFRERRGLGGMLFALKCGGAAAEAGWSLQDVARVIEKTNERTATLSVAVRPPTHPATGAVMFELPEGMIEVGTGVHGEVGVYRGAHMWANDLVDLLMERLLDDLKSFSGRRMLVFLNGAGGTSKMELHILYRSVHGILSGSGESIAGTIIDSFFTTQEMGGFSLSLCAIDHELETLWNAPAHAPSFHMFNQEE